MVINTWRDPYEAGFSPTRPKKIEINPGLTVLVGCNGAGKTTLLSNIKEEAKKNNIPCHFFNNMIDGTSNSIASIMGGFGEEGDSIHTAINLWTASEGEAIKINLDRQSRLYDDFLQTGYYRNRSNKISLAIKGKEEPILTNKRILLFDAVDSGLSVDSIVEVKMVFDLISKKAEELGMELYLIISANEYELARNSNCFDVNEGKYIKFLDYEDYRKFILRSRKNKEKRIEKQKIWFEKKQTREKASYLKKKELYESKINKIKENAANRNRNLTWHEKDIIEEYERYLKEEGRKFSL